MSLHTDIKNQLLSSLSISQTNEIEQLNSALRLLSKWRSHLIQNTILQHNGTVVMEGPLAGLDFLSNSAEGCHVAKLIGCYEQPLLPYIQAAIDYGYETIINIGCAEGYYAVGMAKSMSKTKVMAYDLNPIAQETCAELAAKNGVSDRVTVGALFTLDDFAQYAKTNTLVLCDIEGAEKELLDPIKAEALRDMDIIVESHESMIAGVTNLLVNRFKESHEIIMVEDNGQRQLSNPPKWFNNLAHLDQLLAVWEWRSGPTPWLVMKARNKPHTL